VLEKETIDIGGPGAEEYNAGILLHTTNNNNIPRNTACPSQFKKVGRKESFVWN